MGYLVNGTRLDELEDRGLRFELRSIGALHVKTPSHRAEGRWEWAARSVFEGLARLERRLFAHDAGAVDFFGMAGAVDDRPMAIEKLNGGVAFVGDVDRVEEEPSTRLGVAVLWRIAGANPDANAAGFCFGRGFEKIRLGHARDFSRHFLRLRTRRRQ